MSYRAAARWASGSARDGLQNWRMCFAIRGRTRDSGAGFWKRYGTWRVHGGVSAITAPTRSTTPEYERFIEDFAAVNGYLPYASTALSVRDPEVLQRRIW